MSALRFGSICSGIEAASVAFKPLGWQAAWFSEIDTFANKVLAHHYPEVPNLGDMTALPTRILAGEVEAPDVLCGGTPCQAFSIAGLRKSLDDARGNLTLTFCEIANAIDTQRAEAGKPAAVILWENVPGVLSTGDNAFGCFLGALAGEDVALEPAGGKWSNSGCVYGPQRAIAWRVLDAKHFGLAQRRKRLFVVACPLARAHPTQILFECESGGGDFEPGPAPREDDTRLAEAGAGADGVEQPYKVANCLTRRMHKGINTNISDGQTPVLAYSTKRHNTKSNQAGKFFEEYVPALGRCSPPVAVFAFHENQRAELTLSATRGSLKCGGGKPGQGYPAILDGPVVRVLMPVEAERLQGFPSAVELQFESMTREEAAIVCLINGDISVNAETGAVYGHRGPGGVRLAAPKVIGHDHPSGYREVKITANGVKKIVRVHRLVWLAARGRIPDGMVVDHINNNKVDNRISNLQLLSPEENSSKAHRDGCIDWDAHPNTKLTAEVRDRLSHEYATTECSYTDLAVKHGISKGRVGQIVRESGYTDVPGASDTARYKALGNSWPVPVVAWIGKRIDAAMKDTDRGHA